MHGLRLTNTKAAISEESNALNFKLEILIPAIHI